MLPSLLFILYVALFSWLLIKSKYVRDTGLPVYILLGIFFLKILAGCIYGYVHYHSIYGLKTDTWKFYTESIAATDILKKNPLAFFEYLFSNGYQEPSELISTHNNYWNDLKHNLMIGLMSICNLFSGKHYYINIIFYNAITMLGSVAFYRFCIQYFGIQSKWLVLAAISIPSLLFWSSGFHKEGILFTCISGLLWSSYQLIYSQKIIKHSTLIVICFLTIMVLRNYLFLFFLPFWAWWIFLHYYPKFKHGIGFLMIFIVILFSLLNQPAFIKIVSSTNQQFKNMGGNTTIVKDSVAPTLNGFAQYTPTALENIFLQPNYHQLSIQYFPAFIENILLFIVSIFVLINYKKSNSPFTSYFLLFFCIGSMLFLGFTVPVTGAIIRYKSILLPFLLVALGSMIKLKRSKNKHIII